MGKSFVPKSSLPNYGGSLKIEIKPFGPWEDTIRKFQKLGPKIKRASMKAQLKVANEIARRVRAHIRNQDLGWKELSSKYAERKSDKGLDGRILMAYGNYYRNIEVWQKGHQHMVFVGVKKGKYTRTLAGKRSKLDIATIAVIHEYARGGKIPRRPLWNPTIQELGGRKGIRKMFLASLRFWLVKEGLPVKTINNLGWR